MGTKQPAIARIESGDANVRLSTLRELAIALNAITQVYLEPTEWVEFNPPSPPWWVRFTEFATGMRRTASVPMCSISTNSAAGQYFSQIAQPDDFVTMNFSVSIDSSANRLANAPPVSANLLAHGDSDD
jgi:hypothetical protein